MRIVTFRMSGGNPIFHEAAPICSDRRGLPADTNPPALREVRTRAELKHISKPRKRKQTRFPE